MRSRGPMTVKIEIERGLRPEVLLAAAATPAAPAKAAQGQAGAESKGRAAPAGARSGAGAVPVVDSAEPEAESRMLADDQENGDD